MPRQDPLEYAVCDQSWREHLAEMEEKWPIGVRRCCGHISSEFPEYKGKFVPRKGKRPEAKDAQGATGDGK